MRGAPRCPWWEAWCSTRSAATRSMEATANLTLIGAMHKLEASTAIVIKCGDSEVALTSDGVTIKSMMVAFTAGKIQLPQALRRGRLSDGARRRARAPAAACPGTIARASYAPSLSSACSNRWRLRRRCRPAGRVLRRAARIGRGGVALIEWRGGTARVGATLAADLEIELLQEVAEDGGRVLVEEGPAPLVVGVLQTRRPRELKLRAGTVTLSRASKKCSFAPGRAAIRLREDGDVEIVGSRILRGVAGPFSGWWENPATELIRGKHARGKALRTLRRIPLLGLTAWRASNAGLGCGKVPRTLRTFSKAKTYRIDRLPPPSNASQPCETLRSVRSLSAVIAASTLAAAAAACGGAAPPPVAPVARAPEVHGCGRALDASRTPVPIGLTRAGSTVAPSHVLGTRPTPTSPTRTTRQCTSSTSTPRSRRLGRPRSPESPPSSCSSRTGASSSPSATRRRSTCWSPVRTRPSRWIRVARWAAPRPSSYGVAVTPDDSALVVTSAWGRSLASYDAKSPTLARQWEVALPREPRGVVVSDDGVRAFVAQAVGRAAQRRRSQAAPGHPHPHPPDRGEHQGRGKGGNVGGLRFEHAFQRVWGQLQGIELPGVRAGQDRGARRTRAHPASAGRSW